MAVWKCERCGKEIHYPKGDPAPQCDCQWLTLPDFKEGEYTVDDVKDNIDGVIYNSLKAAEVKKIGKKKRLFKGSGIEVTKDTDGVPVSGV